jgi:hypothetical protein
MLRVATRELEFRSCRGVGIWRDELEMMKVVGHV